MRYYLIVVKKNKNCGAFEDDHIFKYQWSNINNKTDGMHISSLYCCPKILKGGFGSTTFHFQCFNYIVIRIVFNWLLLFFYNNNKTETIKIVTTSTKNMRAFNENRCLVKSV